MEKSSLLLTKPINILPMMIPTQKKETLIRLICSLSWFIMIEGKKLAKFVSIPAYRKAKNTKKPNCFDFFLSPIKY
ncbi:hypothetical protein BSG8_10740 [Bacillus subtilis subsp. natto]|nr:hypothetical protein BsBEST3136_10550 [Bacillus subtilis]BCV99664.1 hypothetical protein BsBEST3145_10600 [Bacillus subtilis]BDB92322.1 hypothetical protein BSG8_10740 [Bacillus subtilis subsp. natto]BEH05089.1 hypothetical protein BSNN_11220 [Bacillus subtilis subsp. natto]